ncbi:hypothetical protein ACFQZC_07555 [Streptacidiphilus monticola]
MSQRRPALLAAGVALCAAATACSSTAATPRAAGSASQDRTLTVWMMDGDLSSQAVAAINARFEAATGAKVRVQIQEWDNINTKISTALAQEDTPTSWRSATPTCRSSRPPGRSATSPPTRPN